MKKILTMVGILILGLITLPYGKTNAVVIPQDACMSACHHLHTMMTCSESDPSNCISFDATLSVSDNVCHLDASSNSGSASISRAYVLASICPPGTICTSATLSDAHVTSTAATFSTTIPDPNLFLSYSSFRFYMVSGATLRSQSIYFSHVNDGYGSGCDPSDFSDWDSSRDEGSSGSVDNKGDASGGDGGGYTGSTGAGLVPPDGTASGGTVATNGAQDTNNNNTDGTTGPVSPGRGSPAGGSNQNAGGTSAQDGGPFSCAFNPKTSSDNGILNLGSIILSIIILATARRKKI